jgi:hypothetical protein
MDLETSIAQLIEADARWPDTIRAAVEWAEAQHAKGASETFRRDTLHFWLGQPEAGVPVLTPLVRIGILGRDITNAKGTPYYRLAADPKAVRDALSRAIARTGWTRT